MGAEQERRMVPCGWDFFDRIYCITLESRPDRRQEARRQFAAVGLDGRIEFLVVAKDVEEPARGIYHSHCRCLAQGLAAGARRILVFEDDVVFHRFHEERLAAACSFLQETPGWEAFFLGCLTNGRRRTGQDGVVRIRYRCLAHAYALHRPFAERIVRQPWQGIPFDELLRRCADHSFALAPMCAFQGLAGSDNGTVIIDRLRNLFGGLPFIQRGNELYHHHKGLVVALHLVVAAAALALFLLARS